MSLCLVHCGAGVIGDPRAERQRADVRPRDASVDDHSVTARDARDDRDASARDVGLDGLTEVEDGGLDVLERDLLVVPDARAFDDSGAREAEAADVLERDVTTRNEGGAPDVVFVEAGPSSTRQRPVPLGTDAAPNGFYEYLPPGYEDGIPRPLLVFLHGIGENGNGTSELSRVPRGGGPVRIIQENAWPAERPFIVLSAQHSGGGCPSADEIERFIAWALTHYRVDRSRVYLTGLSCGAIGSWDYLGAYTNSQVVAAVLVAGDGRGAFARAGCALGRVAIWGLHGDSDDGVAPAGTREAMTNLLGCPQPPRRDAQLTMYPGVGHNSWTMTYDLSAGHDVYGWLLRFTR